MKTFAQPRQVLRYIVTSLQFLVKEERVKVYGFVIMSNHIHFIWQVQQGHYHKNVQLPFMKYTAQMIIKTLRNHHAAVLENFLIKASDRNCQIWERNPLSVSLWNQDDFKRKMDYIHNNPVAAGLCLFASNYHYSSASFYQKQIVTWKFLTHYDA